MESKEQEERQAKRLLSFSTGDRRRLRQHLETGYLQDLWEVRDKPQARYISH